MSTLPEAIHIELARAIAPLDLPAPRRDAVRTRIAVRLSRLHGGALP